MGASVGSFGVADERALALHLAVLSTWPPVLSKLEEHTWK